jgi:hypothetical protein
MTQERAHRKYSPSSAERVINCRGSTELLARVPKSPDSIYAIEGRKAHDVVEAALVNGVRDAREAHENWTTLFFEDLDDGKNNFYSAIQMMLDYVYDLLDEYPDAVLYTERFVDPPVASLPGAAGGYCDVAVHISSIRTLFVIDYKHGAGVAKSAKDNPQPMQYAAGFLYEDDAVVDPASVDHLVLAIIQPRAFHEEGPIREHECTPYDAWEYITEYDEVIAEAEAGGAPLTPGEEQCRFCDASPFCPARESKALGVASSAFRSITDVSSTKLTPPHLLDMERLGMIRFHGKTLRKWLDDCDARCQQLAQDGHAVPGAKLVEAIAQRKYYGDDHEVLRKLAAMIGEGDADKAVDELEAVLNKYPALKKLYRHSIVPITMAEPLVVEAYKRRVGRGRKKQAAMQGKHAFAFLTLKQSSGKLTLVDEDDSRPAANKAQKSFGNIGAGLIAPPPNNT